MSESVLERSVLERKEREELQTIARAMGAEPPVRAKKADLVDLILTTAGIPAVPGDGAAPVEAPATPAPRRRTRRVDATPAVAPVAGPPADEVEAGDSGPEMVAPNGAAPADATSTGGDAPDPDDSDGSDPDASASEGTGPIGAEVPAAMVADLADADPVAAHGSTNGNGVSNGSGNRPPATGTSAAAEQASEAAPRLPLGDQGDGSPEDEVTGNSRRPTDQPPTSPAHGDERSLGRDRENGRPRDNRPQSAPPVVPDDDSETGNRRRRRRGRDREGWREGGVREPAPQPTQQRDGRPDEAFTGEPVAIAGLLDLRDEGYGFVRTKGYLPSKEDAYISVKQARQFGLRKGDHVTGASRPANRNEKNPALLRIDTVNGKDPEEARKRPRFEDLTPLFPDERLKLETPGATIDMTARIVDLIAPIGKGQRGLIVSPPKAGKTTVLKQIVKSIELNNPEVHLMVLLVDERPEEVTDMRRSTKGEVIASTFDRPSDEHTAVAELAGERAKRLVEEGRDVVIVLDGITRLARAYNLAAPATGRIMSGGVDSGALYPPKRFFGSARNIEEGGSLTILATALIETGSKMDEVIFEEFKGTGNMELRLDRRLAERRIYPAIDVDASSTRHEELLFDRKQLQQVWRVRRALNALSSADGATPAVALERLMDGMRTFSSNEEFLAEAAKTGAGATP